jgi:AraC-like DNA-binding protein
LQDRSEIRIEASGQRPEDAIAALPGLYGGTRWSAAGEEYAFRYTAVGDEALTLRTSRMRGSITGDIPVGDDVVVQWLVSGQGRVDPTGEDLRLTPNVPLLFPADRTFVFDYRDYDQRLVHLSRAAIAGLAAERGLTAALRFDHAAAPAEAATALWFDTVAMAARAVRRGPVNDLLWHELTRMTTAAFLELYPPRAEPTDPLLQPGAGAVRQAVEHIRRSIDLPLTPSDVAAAVGISPRALQAGFQRFLGTSPAAYIRSVRLEAAHAELAAADPARTTVAAVARRWGFAHLGRFSAQYRERYGRNPSETLRT